MAEASARSVLEVADWRRQVFALYAAVRAESDPSAGHEIWRTGRDRLFKEHPASPLLPPDRQTFAGLPIAPYRPEWRFEVQIEPAEAETIDVPTGTDGVVSFERIGLVEIPDAGSLDLWRLTSYGGGIFLPVRDSLAGQAGGTYGGGRYLLDTIIGADLGADATTGSLVLDFNFTYNPSCAYDPAWACPLAPTGNVLSVPVPVGELYD